MSGTIKAIERHMTMPVRLGLPVRSEIGLTTARIPRRELGLQSSGRAFIAEWQHRGPEAFSGYAVRKLRLGFAPSQSLITPKPVGAA